MTDEQESSAQKHFVPLEPGDNVGFLLNETARLIRVFSAEALAHLGLSPRQSGILLALSAHRVYSQQALGEMLGIDRTSMVAFINKLEAMELVRRQINAEDRRVYDVSLTFKGEALVTQVDQIIRETQKRFLLPLTEAEISQLGQLLFKLRASHQHKDI